MDGEGSIGLVLARASELRSKIANSIGNSWDTQQIDPNAINEERGNDNDNDTDEEASLSNIRDAFDLLEAQLSSLQELQQQQLYERAAALAEIDNSRQKLLKKLNEYKGEHLEVINEATAFASETVEDNSDLLLPPYPSRPSHPLVSGNGSLSHSRGTRKFSFNGVTNGDQSNELRMGIQDSGRDKAKSGSKSSLRHFINVATKTVVTLVGVISALSLAGFEPRLIKRETQFKVSGLFQQQGSEDKRRIECPPGKVLVFEHGEPRCLVKERVEIPFESVATKPDVNYGCG